MKFNVNQQDLQRSLNYCQGVIEKRSTLPILSNVLLDASDSKLTITATDLDMIFIHSINNVEIIEEGNKFIGKNGGTVTSEDGTVIKAKNFEYDKIKNILIAFDNVEIIDEKEDIIIKSQKTQYLQRKEI